jgi:hypothetical protein
MLEEPLMLKSLRHLAAVTAVDENPPATAIGKLLTEVKGAADMIGLKARWRLHQLFADLLVEAGVALFKKGSFKTSASLFFASLLRDPTKLCSRVFSVFIRRLIIRPLQARQLGE